MDKILANIRAVPGVIGTILVDKSRALTYQLMPASYSSENIKNIAMPLLHLGQSLKHNMSLDFFFENGLARLYNRDQQIMLVVGHLDLNFNTLGMVCREAIPAINRKLTHGQLGLSSTRNDLSTGAGPEFLLKAINIISTNCVSKIGAYMVTKYLRKAKDELSGTYPVLGGVSVDNNGIASFIKGVAYEQDKDTLTAFAHWANLYLSYCAKSTDNLKPADIMELTFEIKDKLDLSGFYQLYVDVGV
ncbi:MAG: hypothetical protein GY839_00075 [candidate division Zixibacteria bacterium]|nr:hypothetical protein [candidate division Zixibacteria bacterium]